MTKIVRAEPFGYADEDAQAQRVLMVGGGTPGPSNPNGDLTYIEGITRYATPGTRTVGAGKKSYSVTVVTGTYPTSPTLGGVPLVAGVHEYAAPEGGILTGLSLVTASGDDVTVRTV